MQKLQALPAKLERWENWLGLIFPAWLALSIGFWIVFLLRRHWASWSWRGRSELIFVALLWLLLDVPYLWRLSVVARRNLKPFAFQVAVGAKTPPLLLRPLVAAWWLGHFAVPFWLVAILARAPIPQARPSGAMDFVIMLMWGLTANGFLMLAVCSMTGSEKTRGIAWNFRLLTDISLAIVAVSFRLI